MTVWRTEDDARGKVRLLKYPPMGPITDEIPRLLGDDLLDMARFIVPRMYYRLLNHKRGLIFET